MDRPTSGDYRLAGRLINDIGDNALADVRRRRIGFVFQRYHLLGSLTAIENVEVPAIYKGLRATKRHDRAELLLDKLGLGERRNHRPTELSGGQQQRVSIARALMNGGEIILADEPTGALDTHSGAGVMDLLKSLNRTGHTIIMVTHDMAVAQHASRVVKMHDGLITHDSRQTHTPQSAPTYTMQDEIPGHPWTDFATRLLEAGRIALASMLAHRIRTSLTLFGIVVGILSVIAVVGLGEGGQRMVSNQINSLAVNSISILPGTGWE